MKPTKRGERKSQPAIGAADALGMLESAIGYCRAAGLTVKGGNVAGALTLAIAGAELAEGGRFVVASKPVPVNLCPQCHRPAHGAADCPAV